MDSTSQLQIVASIIFLCKDKRITDNDEYKKLFIYIGFYSLISFLSVFSLKLLLSFSFFAK